MVVIGRNVRGTSLACAAQVIYWIGLFNAQGVGGRNGSWAWVDQTVYNGSNPNSLLWANNKEPAPGKWWVVKWKTVGGVGTGAPNDSQLQQGFRDDRRASLCAEEGGALCPG
jgi:hypothetical protein